MTLSSTILSIVFAPGTVAALWLLLSVATFLIFIVLLVTSPRTAVPEWVDIITCIAILPLLVIERVWCLLGFAGKSAQRRALYSTEFVGLVE